MASVMNRLQSSTAAQAAPSTAAAASGAVPTTDGTEDRFMKLLVAQMRNQDPLNPLDNAQVTSQLAQINTVRGIDEMNQSLKKLLQRDQGFNPAESASLVGRQVWVPGQQMTLSENQSARGGFELEADAQQVAVTIMNARGQVVDTVELGRRPAGLHMFEWDGAGGSGRLPPGAYTMQVQANAGQAEVGATAIQAAGVRSVLRGPAGLSIELDGGRSVAIENVRGVL